MSIESRVTNLEKAAAVNAPGMRRRDDDIHLALDLAQMDASLPIADGPKRQAQLDRLERLQFAFDTGDRSGLLPDDLDIRNPEPQRFRLSPEERRRWREQNLTAGVAGKE